MFELRFTTHQACMKALMLALEPLEQLILDMDYYDPLLDPLEKARKLTFRCYAEDRTDIEAAKKLLQKQITAFEVIYHDPEIDWVSQSQAGLSPIKAGNWLIHGTHDEPPKGRGRFSLCIDANTAFGTGHHETTRGCLLAWQTVARKKRIAHVLDLGCGSGILALAARLDGARHVIASDIDKTAVTRAILNARKNKIRDIRWLAGQGCMHPCIKQAAPFDLVFANILARPLVELAQELAHISASGGHVILAGFIKSQEKYVLKRYRNAGFFKEFRFILGDWPILILRKRKASAV